MVTNPAQSPAPGALFFFCLMNEPKKIINFCCAQIHLPRMVFCLNIFCACCRGAPSPSLPGRRRGPGAAAVNHRGVIAVWAPSPTTRRLLIGSRLCGTGVPHGTHLDGLCCRVGTCWRLRCWDCLQGGSWGQNFTEEHPGSIPGWCRLSRGREQDVPAGCGTRLPMRSQQEFCVF